LWVEARSSVIRDENGQSVGMRGMTFDMSERKETEERLERAREEAESANRAKDQFLAMLSHELRTPLTPVLTIAQVLEADHDLPDSLRPLIEIVRRNVELEARLIDDLLDLNRIIRGKLPLNTETVDAHGLLRNVVEICQSDLHGAGVRLLLDLGATRTIINADPARVQQVLWNLLKNGIKFTPSDGSITVRTSNDEQGRLVISFRDTGIGIEQSALPKIFQAFEQGAPIITKNFGGLGLGLAISKAIADLHGASLRAESDGPGEGATFTFIIETIDSDTAATTHQRMASIDEDHGKSWRILFVDDHEDTGRVNQLLLERRGYQVKLAHSVTEAKQFSDNEDFDLVISDIGLPDGNGLDVIRYLREHHQSIKGIALSGFGMEEDVVRSMEAGFNHHLTKPVTFNRLLEVIENVMRKSH
jgi:two-component system CheB/CheR fusion protein